MSLCKRCKVEIKGQPECPGCGKTIVCTSAVEDKGKATKVVKVAKAAKKKKKK